MDVLASSIEIEATEAGNIPIGFLFASVKNIGTTPVLVNGVSLAPGEAKGYPFVGKPYNEIPYDPQEGSIRLLYIL